jgi:hypothetical protein
MLMFMGIHGCTHFLQDGAPCDASKCFKEFLAEQPFQVIDWLGIAWMVVLLRTVGIK